MFADVVHDRLVVGDAAREDDAVHAPGKGCGHGSDLLRYVVAQGVEHLLGPLVSLLDALHHLHDGVRSQVGDHASLA